MDIYKNILVTIIMIIKKQIVNYIGIMEDEVLFLLRGDFSLRIERLSLISKI